MIPWFRREVSDGVRRLLIVPAAPRAASFQPALQRAPQPSGVDPCAKVSWRGGEHQPACPVPRRAFDALRTALLFASNFARVRELEERFRLVAFVSSRFGFFSGGSLHQPASQSKVALSRIVEGAIGLRLALHRRSGPHPRERAETAAARHAASCAALGRAGERADDLKIWRPDEANRQAPVHRLARQQTCQAPALGSRPSCGVARCSISSVVGGRSASTSIGYASIRFSSSRARGLRGRLRVGRRSSPGARRRREEDALDAGRV